MPNPEENPENEVASKQDTAAQTDGPPVLFYCKDCQWIGAEAERKGKKYDYKCPKCKSEKVSFGTRQAVIDYFHLKEKHVEEALKNN